MRVRKTEPVERSKTRISIVQAVTSRIRFQNQKIEKKKYGRLALSKRDWGSVDNFFPEMQLISGISHGAFTLHEIYLARMRERPLE